MPLKLPLVKSKWDESGILDCEGSYFASTYGDTDKEVESKRDTIVAAVNEREELIRSLEWVLDGDFDELAVNGRHEARKLLTRIYNAKAQEPKEES